MGRNLDFLNFYPEGACSLHRGVQLWQMVENGPLVIRIINDNLGCFTELGEEFSTLKKAHTKAKSIKKKMGPWDAEDFVYVGYKDSLEFKPEKLCPQCRELAERQGFLKRVVNPEKEGELQKPVDQISDCGTIPIQYMRKA